MGRRVVAQLLEIVGAVAVIVGIAMLAVWLAFVVAGVFMIVAAITFDRRPAVQSADETTLRRVA